MHVCNFVALFVVQNFTPDELESSLRPVFNAVWSQEPEAFAFRQAVDPEALRIPVRLYSTCTGHCFIGILFLC